MAEWKSLPDLLKEDMEDSIVQEGRIRSRLRRYENQKRKQPKRRVVPKERIEPEPRKLVSE